MVHRHRQLLIFFFLFFLFFASSSSSARLYTSFIHYFAFIIALFLPFIFLLFLLRLLFYSSSKFTISHLQSFLTFHIFRFLVLRLIYFRLYPLSSFALIIILDLFFSSSFSPSVLRLLCPKALHQVSVKFKGLNTGTNISSSSWTVS
jgi:hypothetical protein